MSARTLVAALLLLVVPARAQKTSFSGEQAYAHLKVIAGEIGPRPMGSPSEHRAMEYAVQKFKEFGCQEAYIMPMTVAAGINTTSGVAIGVSRGKSGRMIVIGGHIDSASPDVPGANDDGSGAACVIELARVIAGRPHESTVLFCCWGGEEEGLRGSNYFVNHYDRLDSVDLMLQIDMTDGKGDLEIDPDGPYQTSAPRWLTEAAFTIACKDLGYSDIVYDTHSMTMNSAGPGSTGSDHDSFLEKGIPAIDFTSDVSYPIHTPLDNLKTFVPSGLQRSGDIVLRLFERFDSGVPSRTTEKYYLEQFGSTPVFFSYWMIWTFIGLSVALTLIAIVRVRARRPRVEKADRIRWSGVKMLLSVVVIQGFVFFSENLVGLIRGYRFPWVNNFSGFVALGVVAGFIGLWLMLRLANRWRITVDPYVLFLRAAIILLVFLAVMALPGPELAIYPAFALFFLSLAILVRMPLLKLVLAVISPFLMLHLLFPEELGLFIRMFAEIPDQFLYTAITHLVLTLIFTLFMLPFAYGFAAVYRDAGVELRWLRRFETGRGILITLGIAVLMIAYLLTRPLYDDWWSRDVRVEQRYQMGKDTTSVEVVSAEYLDGLKVTRGEGDTVLQGRFTKFAYADPAPVRWLSVRGTSMPAHDSSDTDSTVSIRRSLTLDSQIRPYIVEVSYDGSGLKETRSPWSMGARPRGPGAPRHARSYTWYSFPDSVLTVPVTLTMAKGATVTETVTVTYASAAFPIRVSRPATTAEYRTIVTSADTIRASLPTVNPEARPQ